MMSPERDERSNGQTEGRNERKATHENKKTMSRRGGAGTAYVLRCTVSHRIVSAHLAVHVVPHTHACLCGGAGADRARRVRRRQHRPPLRRCRVRRGCSIGSPYRKTAAQQCSQARPSPTCTHPTERERQQWKRSASGPPRNTGVRRGGPCAFACTHHVGRICGEG